MTETTLAAAMAEPSFYEHGPERVELRETEISRVFIAGELVYKVKKPVVLPFLDYGSLERRRRMCEEEVRLNRRLAPGVYLGARPIVRRGDGFALARGESDETVEWAVEMRRLDEERTFDRLLASGRLETEHVRAAARRLAAFHAEAERAPEEMGGAERLRGMVGAELETLSAFAGRELDARALVAAGRFMHAFLTARRDELLARAAAGRVRDGHGDLRLEHLLLADGVLAFDCIEFDPALRQIDVAADLGFLYMELTARGRPELAAELAAAYRGAGGDPGGDDLLAFWSAYRALVRAKLAHLRAAPLGPGDPGRQAALAEAAALVALAERFRWRARLPLVLAVCGGTASGKTHLARALAGASGLPALGSDPTRKRLAGLAPGERAAPEHYGDAFSRRTYRELGRMAALELERAGGAIVDATFRRAADRRAFADGFGAGRPRPLFVECRAPAAVLERRSRGREGRPGEVSDATSELVAVQQREFEPLDEVEASRHAILRTDRPAAEVVDDLEALLDSRL